MFVFVFSLLVLQCAFALPIEEKETEWAPSRMAYARDFDRWFNWVPSWGANDEKKPKPSIKERIQILETRQKVLFNLVRCESYGQTDCSPFRTQAETIFEVPSKAQNLTPPTKISPGVTTPGANKNQEQSTPATTAVPVETSTVGSTAAPIVTTADNTDSPLSTTISSDPAVTETTTQA